MYRKIEDELLKWSNNENRKPLILLGARQVGKTYSINHFAQKYFDKKNIYINFMLNKEYMSYLKEKTDPDQILETISISINQKIENDWLIIFDEIQEMPNIKNSFKLFNEFYKGIRIVGMGSYLGNLISNDNAGFPVGQVDFLHMYPLSFEEYLYAIEKESLVEIIKESVANLKPLSDHHHSIIMEHLKDYWIIGGMPEVIYEYTKNKSLIDATRVKNNIIYGYKNDITKYINSNSDKIKCINVFDNIPIFLSKENNSFLLSKINKNARFRDYQDALNSLSDTHLIYKVCNLKNFCSPLMLYREESKFKIYYNDIGFISSYFNLNKNILWSPDNETYAIIRGSIAENFIYQELFKKIDNLNDTLFYYSFNDQGRMYELDLVLTDINGNLIPVEIKAGDNFKRKSLTKFLQINSIKYAIVFSGKNFSTIHSDNEKSSIIMNIPLYWIGFLEFEMNMLKIEAPDKV